MDKNKQIDDQDIIKRCLDGDKEIFSEIIDRYKNLVYSVILKMTDDREEANDISQEVFVKVYNNLEKYTPEYKFSTWIIRITVNHIIDYRRKKKYETVSFDDVEYSLGTVASPEDKYIKKERMNNINKLINDLPEIYRVPIVLYHGRGLSYNEISKVINEPMSKVKNRIFRGRKLLKDSMDNGKERDGYGLWQS